MKSNELNIDSYMKATAGSLLILSIRLYFNYILVNLLRFNDSLVGSMVLKSILSLSSAREMLRMWPGLAQK